MLSLGGTALNADHCEEQKEDFPTALAIPDIALFYYLNSSAVLKSIAKQNGQHNEAKFIAHGIGQNNPLSKHVCSEGATGLCFLASEIGLFVLMCF
jgi:hypothetical protein